jgi:hypothetical protein
MRHWALRGHHDGKGPIPKRIEMWPYIHYARVPDDFSFPHDE